MHTNAAAVAIRLAKPVIPPVGIVARYRDVFEIDLDVTAVRHGNTAGAVFVIGSAAGYDAAVEAQLLIVARVGIVGVGFPEVALLVRWQIALVLDL